MGQSAGPPAIATAAPRLVVPFVRGKLNRATAAAAVLSGLPVRWAQLPADDEGAYGRLFRALWEAGETFLILEHDVVPTEAQLADISRCGHGWCSFPYADDMYPFGPMFGLCRFDTSVMEAHPYAASVATIIGKRRDEEAEWWRVDSLVARDLMIRQVPWIAHDPPVQHAHVGVPSGPL